MSKLDEPPRLIDAGSDTTDRVRGVLRAGKRGLPDADSLARLAARLPLGPLPPPTSALPKPPLPRLLAPIAAPSVLPGVIVGALLGLGVATGMWWRDAASAPAATFTVASPATIASARIAAPKAASSLAEARADRLDPQRIPAPPSAGAARVAAPLDTGSDARAVDAPSPAESAAPAADATAVVDSETEVHLLQRAQAALGADPATALALTVAHARRFPGGALGQESELIAVTALVALGRKPEAEARAASLLERFPSSAYRGRLESLGLGRSFQKNDPASPRTE